MEHIQYAYTRGMDEGTVESRIREAATGVLALARDGTAYALPMAHHFEEGTLYFRWGSRPGSRKQEFLTHTGEANYVIYGTEPTDDARDLASWSIHASGPIRPLPAEEAERFDTAAINEAFAPIRVFDEAIDEIEISILEMRIDSLAGRETEPA